MVEKLEQDNLYIPNPLDITFETTIGTRPKRLDKVDWQPDTTKGKKVFEYIDKLGGKWKITVGKSSENQYDIRVQKLELIESTGDINWKTKKYCTGIIAKDETEFSENLSRILDGTIGTISDGKRGKFKRTSKKIFKDLSKKSDTLGDDSNNNINYNKKNIEKIFNIKNKIIDLSGDGVKWQNKRYNNYLLNNEFRNVNYQGPEQRKKVIDGFCRMVESGDINMIFEEADAAGVPRQCIYLALAESGWQAGANSGVAVGCRQFTKQSAIDFKLNEKGGPDNRKDKVKSTQAAMRHLKANYKIVCNYEKELNYNLSESDKWYLAFSMFNGSPGLVKSGMIACKGNINNYPDKLKQPNGKDENNNYMPRILAIQNILEELFIDNDYNIEKIKLSESTTKVTIHTKTEADIMYEEYIKKSKDLTNTQKIEELNKIMRKYKKEQQEWKITKKYYEGAISVIERAMTSLEKSKADTRFENLERRGEHLSVGQKIGALKKIAEEYDQEYKKGEITKAWHDGAIKVIQTKIKELEKLK